MEDYVIMSKEELHRKTLLEGVRNKQLTLLECSERLCLSYRQMKRIWRRYLQEGDKGLCHRSRGQSPKNAYSHEHKERILKLYADKYRGFGPTLASEKLEEDDGIKVKAETLRLWLKYSGLWGRKRKYIIYRERRERRARFGDLIQIDGSIHDWFSEGSHSCLLNMVDDATGITFALLDTGETTSILLSCLKRWIEKYGIPKSVYVDLKSVYIGTKPLRGNAKDWDEEMGLSVFQEVCGRLGIDIIKAYSPQAKGRVERKHQVFQDCFLKDLKLYKISTFAEANKYLENIFLDKINKKFAVTPEDPIDNHRDPALYGDLNEILCWQYQRQLRNDWSIRFKNQYFQLHKLKEGSSIRPGCFIRVKKYLGGVIKFWYNEVCLAHHVLPRKPEPSSKFKKYYVLKGPVSSEQRSILGKKGAQKSPWQHTNASLFVNTKQKPLIQAPQRKNTP